MTYATISIDRREAYYERAAQLIAANPLGFYSRAERGRRVQAAIQPKDLTWDRLKSKGAKPAPVVDLSERRAAKAAR